VINQHHLKALRTVCEKLKDADVNWVLGGSTNLALQGVDLNPRDIDILTDREGAFTIEKLIKDYKIKSVEFTKSEKIASYQGKFRVEGVEVEVMGALQIKTAKAWTKPLKPWRKRILKTEGIEIPVNPLEIELRAYRRLGRMDRVRKILEVMP